jgi:hypothetical protein
MEKYNVEDAVDDLCREFVKGASKQKIIEIGQKIYGAGVPIQNGVGGMHQAYHLFVKKMPSCGKTLSQIWDGIGDWAD